MSGLRRLAGVLVVGGLLVALAAGCGGSSSSAETSTNPSAAFLGHPKKPEELAEYGREANAAEREEASKALEENLQARASGDWVKQCATLSPLANKRTVVEATSGSPKGCVEAVEFLAGVPNAKETKSIRENTMTGPIDVLRVKERRGYALYHGTKGQDYAMLMEHVHGHWITASLTTQEIP